MKTIRERQQQLIDDLRAEGMSEERLARIWMPPVKQTDAVEYRAVGITIIECPA